MALPGDTLATEHAPRALLDPDELGRLRRVTDYERGGIAIGDPSAGLEVQNWRLRLVGNDVLIAPEPYDAEALVFSEAGITELSLAFDQNMAPTIAYVAFNQAKLRWYDPVAEAIVTDLLSADVKSPFVTMDDKRSFAFSYNDVLLFYVRSNRLCYRQQRERYDTERTLQWFDGAAVTIRKAGMNVVNRVQVELVGLGNAQAIGAVLAGWTVAAYLASVTSIAGSAPADIEANDGLHAAVMHRSAATPPAGWTLVASRACDGDVAQTVSVFKKDAATPADSGVSFAFTQAASDRMGLAYFVVRRTDGAAPTFIGSAGTSVDDLATNTVTAPILTAAAVELFVMVATSVNATAAVTKPSVAPGMSLVSSEASQCRMGVAYQRRKAGQTNAGRFTFDNGSPANNGLAAITLRFS